MPVIFRYKGYRVFFYSNEGNPREPLHVHVQRGEALAKFWIDPVVSIANNYGLSGSEMAELMQMIETRRSVIEEAWHEFFGE
ncbi:MAG: DUF4160 domain-containing protein [Halothiobacillaceae bacterium]